MTTDIWVVRDMDITVELHRAFGGDDAVERQCKEVIAQIERHVDDVAAAYIVKHYVCRFCGYEKDAAVDADGNPECCTAAVEAYEQVTA